MKRFLGCVSVLFLWACTFAGSGEPDWLNHPKWDDGLAEVALYEGTLIRYGTPRAASLEVVTVREHFHPEKLVKTRPGKGENVLPVMKTNMMRRVRTGVYEYVQMASVFQNRENGRLLKLSCVSAEWCGNSFALYESRGEGGRLVLSNYMDDRGTSILEIQAGKAIFHEELLPWLRQNLDTVRAGTRFRIIGSLLSNNPVYGETDAVILEKKTTPAPARLHGGTGTAVVLRIGRETETFLFADDALHTLLRWKNGSGESFELRKKIFMDYWNRNRPGDEAVLEFGR